MSWRQLQIHLHQAMSAFFCLFYDQKNGANDHKTFLWKACKRLSIWWIQALY